jgi:uncharacterized membrane-anchored protein
VARKSLLIERLENAIAEQELVVDYYRRLYGSPTAWARSNGVDTSLEGENSLPPLLN